MQPVVDALLGKKQDEATFNLGVAANLGVVGGKLQYDNKNGYTLSGTLSPGGKPSIDIEVGFTDKSLKGLLGKTPGTLAGKVGPIGASFNNPTGNFNFTYGSPDFSWSYSVTTDALGRMITGTDYRNGNNDDGR